MRSWRCLQRVCGAGRRRQTLRCGGARRRLGRQRGFTLIELLVASGYFLIGITGVMLLQVAAATNSASAGDLMLATTLTANQIETLRHMPAATLATLGPQTYYFDRFGKPAAAPPGWFQVSYTFVAPTGAIAYTAVTVTTSWKQSPVNPFQHGVTMSTYIGGA